MRQVAEELPIKVTTQTMDVLEGEVSPADAWSWIERLIESRFLVNVVPGGLRAVRGSQNVRLLVREEKK
jgi:hypothetical protein